MQHQKLPILATGCVRLQDNMGNDNLVRVLFDKGSEMNLISEACVKRLNLKREKCSMIINTVTSNELINYGMVKACIKPWFKTSEMTLVNTTFLVMKKLPNVKRSVLKNIAPEFDGLIKADSEYYQAGKIDILLGVEIWSDIIESGIIIRSNSGLTAQPTKFGYAIFGAVKRIQNSLIDCHVLNTNMENELEEDLKKLLCKFWELEEQSEKIISVDDERAEKIYKETVARTEDGRYIVRIPLISDDIELGDSRAIALKQFIRLEQRLERDSDLRIKYNKFMREFIDLNHMRKAAVDERKVRGYFMPHHPVIQKFRVVFNASCLTTNNKSFNDIQLTGSNLQEVLSDIMMNFRFHKYVLSADIKKMFRQILIHKEDLPMQKIFWRFNKDDPLEEYVLLTVTYGMKASPFLAIRTMLQLAMDYEKEYPRAAYATRFERYMDDYMTGCDSEEQLLELYHQLKQLVSQCQMDLDKWKTNSEMLVEEINDNTSKEEKPLELNDELTSILGVKWHPSSDCFSFVVHEISTKIITKRTITSTVARIYDPSGYLSPIIITARAFIQELWKSNVDWDDQLNEKIKERWIGFCEDLRAINYLKVPRWLHTTKRENIELYGFADASEIGYGAAIYVRCAMEKGTNCNLLTSKTRVAPVKTVSIPRLELCACEMLAKLMKRIRIKCNLEHVSYHLFTDSKIALSWIANYPSNLKVFVANRVASIQRNSEIERWQHISSKDNPADIASRGIKPCDLLKNDLWWHGPTNLSDKMLQSNVKVIKLSDEEALEIRNELKPIFTGVIGVNNFKWLQKKGLPLIECYSSITKIERITAYVFQAKEIFMRRANTANQSVGRLTRENLMNARDYWIRFTQLQHFGKEFHQIEQNISVDKSSELRNLVPFIGKDQLLRVSGRLLNASIPYDERHPIIIPAHSTLQKLLMQEAHNSTLHGNIQMMRHYLNRRYWIIGAKRAAKAVIKRCVKCQNHLTSDKQQLMSDLPKERLTPSRPFYYCGVDYFGPIKIKRFEGRCRSIDIGYGAVFVCLTTRMVHIECVTNLTSERFLWALSRLASIYQLPIKMFSDNGTNFKGASNELRAIKDSWNSKDVENYLTIAGTQWKFIAPRAPFEGGLWEAAVKSTKYHLKRVLENQRLTYEQYQTLFYKIGAVLNSRPLVPLSEDPTELNYLTPSHAVIGERIVQPLAMDMSDIPLNKINQHKLVDKIHQDFWKIWRKEYLGTMQNRYKWNSKERNLKVGDLVIRKEENLPPGSWPIARVIEVYPKNDIVHNVKIKTPKTELVRSVRKLVRLYLDDDQSKEPEENNLIREDLNEI